MTCLRERLLTLLGYDDVNPTGGVDQSGTLSDGNPQVLSVFVGGT
jgi:hypothetical protein